MAVKMAKKFMRKEVDIEELINRGAEVKQDRKKKKSFFRMNLRMPSDMICGVDGAMESRVGISRNGWILEAIQEKLRKEKKDDN